MEEKDIVKKIREGHEQAIVDLYNKYKEEFVNWSYRRYQIDGDDALDIFQDTMIAFYESIQSGKLNQITYQVKTYLFAMAKNLIFNKLKFEKRFDHQADPTDNVAVVNIAEKDFEITDRHQFMIGQLQGLGEPCFSILRLFFYNSYSMEAIAQELNYKNADVVKSQKLRCIKELKNRVRMNYKKEDI
ncbi:MAG: RNA polymerase sigma factor [Cyclobacteriaceae bacterium]